MGKKSLKERIAEDLFLLDGAMGTQLFARGIQSGICNEYLNIEKPDVICRIHSDYIQADSDAVITNTFGANEIALAKHNLADKVKQINTEAVKLARQAAGQEKYVLGDIGPSGDFLAPIGTLSSEKLKNALAEQGRVLVEAGVDGFIIETMTAIEEIEVAIEAVKSVCSDLPVFASMAFDKAGGDFRTMMGVNVETAVSNIVALGVDAVGFNCGKAAMDEYVDLALKFACAIKSCNKEVLLLAEPNAGLPEMIEGQITYKVTPEDFAVEVEKIYKAGVTIVGGCCGTGPDYIKAVAEVLKK